MHIRLKDISKELIMIKIKNRSREIHNENNCEAFNKEIDFLIKRIKEQCEEELQ